MCGIAGLLALPGGAPPEPAELATMAAALAHRGPDGAGHHLDDAAGLAIRRLALVDPGHGDQPLANEDGTILVVCNGELYDHRALRRDLERRGHTFRTRLGRRGARAPLRGARPGVRRGPARDVRARAVGRAAASARARPRPVRDQAARLRARVGGRLVFASELKALLALPGFPRDIDPEAVEDYLALNAVPAPATIFRAARKLEPGHRLIAEAGRVRIERYARPRPLPPAELRREPLEALAAEARERLAELGARAPRRRRARRRAALGRRRLQPDHGARRPAALKTFSIGFDVAAFDELAGARAVAERYGTDHHELRLGPGRGRRARGRGGDLRRALAATPPRCPTGCSPASPPVTSRPCSRARARTSCSAAIRPTPPTGSAAERRAPPRRSRPRSPAGRAPPGGLSLDFRLRRLALGAGLGPLERHHAFKETFAARAARRRCSAAPRATRSRRCARRYAETAGAEPIARLQDVDIGSFLADDLLPQADRAGMAHGLEIRVPFLDPVVAELAYALPLTRARARAARPSGCCAAPPRRCCRRRSCAGPSAASARRSRPGCAARWRSSRATCCRPRASPARAGSRPRRCPRCSTATSARREDLGRPLWALIAFGLWHDAWAVGPAAAAGGARADPAGGRMMPSGAAASFPRGMRRAGAGSRSDRPAGFLGRACPRAGPGGAGRRAEALAGQRAVDQLPLAAVRGSRGSTS